MFNLAVRTGIGSDKAQREYPSTIMRLNLYVAGLYALKMYAIIERSASRQQKPTPRIEGVGSWMSRVPPMLHWAAKIISTELTSISNCKIELREESKWIINLSFLQLMRRSQSCSRHGRCCRISLALGRLVALGQPRPEKRGSGFRAGSVQRRGSGLRTHSASGGQQQESKRNQRLQDQFEPKRLSGFKRSPFDQPTRQRRLHRSRNLKPRQRPKSFGCN
jgi:hypothetical protein